MWTGDTIVAISSAPPPARRVVIRLSGPAALRAARSVASPLPGTRAAVRVSLHLPTARAETPPVEVPAIAYLFRAPASYTGEDVVELGLPGSPWVVQAVLTELLGRPGVRQAEPGEFTARAFLAGKLDLTAAEGVAATIAAADQRQLDAARQLRSGELARALAPLTGQLAELLARVEAGIDFSDEDVRFLSSDELLAGANRLVEALSELLARGRRFGVLVTTPRIVLAGPPNAGKSTLLNTLTGQIRAVATPIAGTTRDALESRIRLPRGEALLVDTAGLETEAVSSDGTLASAMADAAHRAVATADVLVWVLPADCNRPAPSPPRHPDLLVRTMADRLGPGQSPTAVDVYHPGMPQPRELIVSARSGAGLSELRDALDLCCFGRPGGDGLALTSRHLHHLDAALHELTTLSLSLRNGAAADELAALSLRAALDELGHITGAVSPDDVLGRVFATFCIGK